MLHHVGVGDCVGDGVVVAVVNVEFVVVHLLSIAVVACGCGAPFVVICCLL